MDILSSTGQSTAEKCSQFKRPICCSRGNAHGRLPKQSLPMTDLCLTSFCFIPLKNANDKLYPASGHEVRPEYQIRVPFVSDDSLLVLPDRFVVIALVVFQSTASYRMSMRHEWKRRASVNNRPGADVSIQTVHSYADRSISRTAIFQVVV